MKFPTLVGAVSVDHAEVVEEHTALTARDLALPLQVFPNTAVDAVTEQDSLLRQAASTTAAEVAVAQSAT